MHGFSQNRPEQSGCSSNAMPGTARTDDLSAYNGTTRFTPDAISLTIGFSLFLALASISAWGLITFTYMEWLGREWIVRCETLRSIGFLFTLFAFGLGCLRLTPLFRVNTTLPSAVLWAAGYAALFSMTFSGRGWGLLEDAASVCLGIAHGLAFIVWQRAFAACPDAIAAKGIVVGSALGSIVYLLVSLISNAIAYMLVIALLVCSSSWLLARVAKPLFPRGHHSTLVLIDPGSHNALRNFMASAWRYAMCVAVVGYVSGVSRMLVRFGDSDTIVLNIMLAAGMLLACVALLVLWEGLHRSFSFRSAYTVIFFIMAVGLILLPFLGSGYYTLFAGVANLAFTMLSMFMMITCIRLSHLRSIDPVGTFGLFATIVYSGVFLGRIVGSSMLGNALGISQVLLAVLLCIYALSFSSVIIGMARKSPRGGIEQQDFDPLDSSSHIPSDTVVATDPSTDSPNTSALHSHRSSSGQGTWPKPISPAEANQPARPPQMLRSVVVVQDAIPACCQAMKQAYQLSNREADVLELIIRGRDTAHMAEALFVSREHRKVALQEPVQKARRP